MPVLSAYKSYSLRERVPRLQVDHGIQLSHMGLFMYYRRHGVQYRKTDLASVNKIAKATTIQREQLELVDWVDQVDAAGGKQLFYLDETSVHCWLTKRACWRDAG